MQNAFPIESVSAEPVRRWFAIHTRYQHEKLVAASLTHKGLDVFLPTYDSVHRWSDRQKRITMPLFPGYLFFANSEANEAETSHWVHVISTPGVNAIIKSGNMPAEIPQGEIAAIRRMVESTLAVEPHPFLSDGDRVRIKSGPLAGLEGIVSRKKDALRLVLSVELLGRSAAVEIDGAVLERLGASGASGSSIARAPRATQPLRNGRVAGRFDTWETQRA